MANNKNNSSGLVTAYEYNSRAPSAKTNTLSTPWHNKINQLLASDYSFLSLNYASGGVLYRGMSAGTMQSIMENHFINFPGSNPHSALEQELDVYFVSHELSDALTVARLWEKNDDCCLLCFSSDQFNEKYRQKQAAVMAFSEPGFVFNYPFLAEGLKIEDLLVIYLNTKTYNQLKNQLDQDLFVRIKDLVQIIDDSITALGRSAVENTIKEYLINKNYYSARLIEASDYPKK